MFLAPEAVKSRNISSFACANTTKRSEKKELNSECVDVGQQLVLCLTMPLKFADPSS